MDALPTVPASFQSLHKPFSKFMAQGHFPLHSEIFQLNIKYKNNRQCLKLSLKLRSNNVKTSNIIFLKWRRV